MNISAVEGHRMSATARCPRDELKELDFLVDDTEQRVPGPRMQADMDSVADRTVLFYREHTPK